MKANEQDTDGRFLSELGRSHSRVNDWALKLSGIGVDIWLPPVAVRPSYEQRNSFADTGDARVFMRVEHKTRKLSFTGRDDYPFETVIIDEKRKVDAKQGDRLLAIVIENSEGTCAAVVYGWTRPHWETEIKRDTVKGYERAFYVVNKRHVRFCKPWEFV